MKSARESWVFIVLMPPFMGLGMWIEGGVTGLGAGLYSEECWPSCFAPGSPSFPNHSSSALYTPLTQSLADADALTAHCRVKVAAELKEERKKIAAKREEDLMRAENNYRKTFAAAEKSATKSSARSTRFMPTRLSRSRPLASANCDPPSTPTSAA